MIPHEITPTLSELQEELEKAKARISDLSNWQVAATSEISSLKIALRNETRKADKEIIENGVLDSIIDKLIEALK